MQQRRLEIVEAPFGETQRIIEFRALFRKRVGRRAGSYRTAVEDRASDGVRADRGRPDRAPETTGGAGRGRVPEGAEAGRRYIAIGLLHQFLPQRDTPIPGLRNGGLFAMQVLEHGVLAHVHAAAPVHRWTRPQA